MADFVFDPMRIKLRDLGIIEREYGVKMLKFIKQVQKAGGLDFEELEINELKAMVYISMAASGREPTVAAIDEMGLGEMMDILGSLEAGSEPVTPTTS